MGYTHYWKNSPNVGVEAYLKALTDCRKIVRLAKKGLLGNGSGDEGSKPQLTGMIEFNGIGDESHETFYMPGTARELEDFQFCKTQRKPYDTVVTACLAVMATAGVEVSSDGDEGDWNEGVALASVVLKRAIPNPLAKELFTSGNPAPAVKPAKKKKPRTYPVSLVNKM